MLSCLEELGGGAKNDLQFSHLVAPLPVINDRSLRGVGEVTSGTKGALG